MLKELDLFKVNHPTTASTMAEHLRGRKNQRLQKTLFSFSVLGAGLFAVASPAAPVLVAGLACMAVGTMGAHSIEDDRVFDESCRDELLSFNEFTEFIRLKPIQEILQALDDRWLSDDPLASCFTHRAVKRRPLGRRYKAPKHAQLAESAR